MRGRSGGWAVKGAWSGVSGVFGVGESPGDYQPEMFTLFNYMKLVYLPTFSKENVIILVFKKFVMLKNRKNSKQFYQLNLEKQKIIFLSIKNTIVIIFLKPGKRRAFPTFESKRSTSDS